MKYKNEIDGEKSEYGSAKAEEVNMLVPVKMTAFLKDFENGRFSAESLVMLLYPLLKKREIEIEDVSVISGLKMHDIEEILDGLGLEYSDGLTLAGWKYQDGCVDEFLEAEKE